MRRLALLFVFVTTLFMALGGSGNVLFAQTPAATMAPTQATNPLLAQLPASLQALYVNATSPILPSAYDTFKAGAGPWKISHSEPFTGNPVRVFVPMELSPLAS